MTNPVPIRRPVPIVVAQPRWCSRCSIHQSTTAQPLCPVCVDDIRREAKQ